MTSTRYLSTNQVYRAFRGDVHCMSEHGGDTWRALDVAVRHVGDMANVID